MRENNLFNALSNFFSESDAFLLAELLKDNLCKETGFTMTESAQRRAILKAISKGQTNVLHSRNH